jgi:hypothetical protein
LLDSLSKSSVNRIRRFNDHAQILSERVMKWTRDCYAPVPSTSTPHLATASPLSDQAKPAR